MLQSLRQISLLNKIFNVDSNEWPKIAVTWLIRFLYRVGFVIGWTILVAMFVGQYGIAGLPYLLILNALFSVLGSLFYSTFLDRVRREDLMVFSIFAAGVLLFSAVQLAEINIVWFFALLIVAVAIFLNQFRIILSAYIEDLFTPLESERTFPLIEAADTFGGIVAGVTVLSLASLIETYNFVYLWLAALFLIIPLIFFCERKNERVTLLAEKRRRKKSVGLFAKFRKALSGGNYVSYIKGLFVIVFLQWFLFNLLEFQYTKAVYQNLSNVVFEAGSGFEHAFVHDLGVLFVLFSSSALLIQLFVGGRLINHLGVIGSMLIHPVVTLLSLFGMALKFNFGTAVLAKNNFTITSVLHTNAYHTSYYAIHGNMREQIRELLEGIVRPLGAVFGTLVLILLQKLFLGDSIIVAVNVAMLIIGVMLLSSTLHLRKRYTKVALDSLNSGDYRERSNAIDILAQRGHKRSEKYLTALLENDKERLSVRVKALHALAELQCRSSIPKITSCLDSTNTCIRVAALEALGKFRAFRSNSKRNVYLKYSLTEKLQTLYRKESDSEVISRIIRLMSLLSSVATVEFLIKVVRRARGNHKAEAILALGKFKDPEISEFLEGYLRSKSQNEQINAAISLYAVRKYRLPACAVLTKFLKSSDDIRIGLALYAIGELRLKKYKIVCRSYLHSRNDNLAINAAFALAKMNSRDSLDVLIKGLFSDNAEVSKMVKKELRNLDVRILKNVDKIVRDIVENELEQLLDREKTDTLIGLSEGNLLKVRHLYSIVEEYEEVELIDNILHFNKA